MNLVAALCLFLASLPAAMGQEKPLTGTYRVSGQTLVDPPANEPRDTHLQLTLSGTSARDLYDAMKVPARPDLCLGGGALRKSAGPMQCMRTGDGRKFECSFAIDIARQRITVGSVC
jgi:hypothetical protein